MPDDIEYNEKYIKGFNDGYLLSKYDPDLAGKLATVKDESPRMEGLRDGISEFLNEKAHYPQWLKRDFTKGIDVTDRSSKEPDRDKE